MESGFVKGEKSSKRIGFLFVSKQASKERRLNKKKNFD